MEAETTTNVDSPCRELLLFAVDARKNMYEQNEDKVPLMAMVLGSVKECFKSKVIADAGDLLGVVLFGTSKMNNPNDLENIYVLLELDVPDPESILYLETLERTPEWMLSQFGGLERYAKLKFQNLLFTCRSLFHHSARSKTLNLRKRLLLFTDDDDPIEDAENQKNACIRQARDLVESGISIELVPLKSITSKPFDYHLFYEDIIGGTSPPELEPSTNSTSSSSYHPLISKLEQLQQHIRKKQYRKRVLMYTILYLDNDSTKQQDTNTASCSSQFGDGGAVGWEVYALFHRATKSRKVLLEARNNEPVRRVSISYSEQSGALVTNSNDIRYSFPFDGVACVFTPSEMEQLGHLRKYGMELIGFEHKDKLKWQYNIRPSYFLYPSDRTIKGSQFLVSVLWRQMLQQNQIAIVRVRFRRYSHPRLAALVPQEEKKNQSSQGLGEPCGFRLIWLPFAEDIRKEWRNQYPKWNNLPSKQCVQAAMNLISKLSIPSYQPTNYSDPDIQQYYNGLQALALNQSNLPQVKDTLDVDDVQMANVAKKQLQEWSQYVHEEPIGIMKQEKTCSSSQQSTVIHNMEKNRAKQYLEELELDWKALAADYSGNGLEKQNMTTLKMFCTAHDLKKSGRKAELIERIREYLQTEET